MYVHIKKFDTNLGYLPATYNLGVCYHFGMGIEKDIEKAKKLYKKSAETGFKEAIKINNLLKQLRHNVDIGF